MCVKATDNNRSFVIPVLIHPDVQKSDRPLEIMVFRTTATRPVFLVSNANEESTLEAAQIKPVQRDGGAMMDDST